MSRLPLILIMNCFLRTAAMDIPSLDKLVRQKQESLKDLEVSYRKYDKGIGDSDTSVTFFSGFFANRKDWKYNGKWTRMSSYKGTDGHMYQDTAVVMADRKNIISRRNARKYYDVYSSYDQNLSFLYKGFLGVDLAGFTMSDSSSGFYILISRDTGRDVDLGISIPSYTELHISKKDFIIYKVIEAVEVYNDWQYERSELLSYRVLTKKEKHKKLNNLAIETKTVKNKYQTYEEYRQMMKTIKRRAPVKPLRVGDTFPVFCGQPAAGGDSVCLDRLQDSLILLDYFFTTCGPCMAAVPHLSELYTAYHSKGLGIYGVDPIDNDHSRLGPYITRMKIEYPLFKTAPDIAHTHGIYSYPTLFLLDSNRVIIAVYEGFSRSLPKKLEEQIIMHLKN